MRLWRTLSPPTCFETLLQALLFLEVAQVDVGNTSINLVKDGTFMVDGGVIFGQLARTQWEQFIKPDRRNRIRLGLNSVLVRTPDLNVLIDTGAGSVRLVGK